jgi:hypothetical protein
MHQVRWSGVPIMNIRLNSLATTSWSWQLVWIRENAWNAVYNQLASVSCLLRLACYLRVTAIFSRMVYGEYCNDSNSFRKRGCNWSVWSMHGRDLVYPTGTVYRRVAYGHKQVTAVMLSAITMSAEIRYCWIPYCHLRMSRWCRVPGSCRPERNRKNYETPGNDAVYMIELIGRLCLNMYI